MWLKKNVFLVCVVLDSVCVLVVVTRAGVLRHREPEPLPPSLSVVFTATLCVWALLGIPPASPRFYLNDSTADTDNGP